MKNSTNHAAGDPEKGGQGSHAWHSEPAICFL